MTHGRYTANGKARLRPDKARIGLAKRLARQRAGLARIHLVAACSDEQNRLAAGFAAKDHRFADLVDLAARLIGRFNGRPSAAVHLHHISGQPGLFEGPDNALEALAHVLSPVLGPLLPASPATRKQLTLPMPPAIT